MGERLEGVVWKEAPQGVLPNPCPPASSRSAGTASFMLLASSSDSVKAKRKKAAKGRRNREQESAQGLEIADREGRSFARI